MTLYSPALFVLYTLPEMTPLLLMYRLLGSLPETIFQLASSAVASSFRLNAAPRVSLKVFVRVVISSFSVTFRVNAFEAVRTSPLLSSSETATVKLLLCAVVGVPEMTPLPLSVSPSGRLPEVTCQLSEPPAAAVALRVALYATSRYAEGRESVPITGTPGPSALVIVKTWVDM